MCFNLSIIDWTAISSIITGIMAILTLFAIIAAFRSAKAAKNSTAVAKQANDVAQRTLREMIYQREQMERPYIVIAFDCSFDNYSLFFTITNFGNRPATDVSVSFDDDFLIAVGNQNESEMSQESLVALSKPFYIAPHQSYKVYFGSIGSNIMKRTEDVVIDCTYKWLKSDNSVTAERNETRINLGNYHWISERWRNKGNQPIDKIAKSLNQIDKNISFLTKKMSIQEGAPDE